MRPVPVGLATLLLASLPAAGFGQQYRLQVESRFQSVSFRGVALDSVPVSATVPAPGGGRRTGDGFAVECGIGDMFCYFFRPGTTQTARPAVTSAAATVWGLGVPGLSLRGSARLALDLGDEDVWPGTSPAVQLLEAYAEYATEHLTARAGRQVYASRLGWSGFDGARGSARLVGGRLDLDGYLGWGLGRASALPVTSPALNPLDDFQPRQRQLVAGAALGWNHRWGTARVDYQREVDPRSDYFVSERAALAATLRLPAPFHLDLGAEYDMARARWGTSDATLRFSHRLVSGSMGIQHYRPYFDLWTIWGAFSPVGYTGVNGSVSVSPIRDLAIRARGRRYWYEPSETETPLVSVEDRGWEIGAGATLRIGRSIDLSADHLTEFGPGGSATSISGAVRYAPRPAFTLGLEAGRVNRPLEFRFDEATLYQAGLHADWRVTRRWRGMFAVSRVFEERDRPDAAAFDWDQTRLSLGLALDLGWED